METFDAVVVGAGHAGCEAALALARMGHRTLLLTLNLDALALMPCNPAIGGTGKGHLVREVDALGGEMGMAIDDTFIQSRMLNTGKGPAVHSLRAQADKLQYRLRMRRAVDDQDHLEVRQAEVSRIEVQNGRVVGVTTTTGERVACRAAVICAGVYLKSRIIIGECAWNGGPQGLLAANALTDCLERPRLCHPPLQDRHARAPRRPHHRLFPNGAAAGRRAGDAVFLPDRRFHA